MQKYCFLAFPNTRLVDILPPALSQEGTLAFPVQLLRKDIESYCHKLHRPNRITAH